MRRYRQLLLTDFYRIINKKRHSETNYCIICNCDLGPQNPRQLCEKTYCPWTGLIYKNIYLLTTI
jgi:hypothetical protein